MLPKACLICHFSQGSDADSSDDGDRDDNICHVPSANVLLLFGSIKIDCHNETAAFRGVTPGVPP